MATTPFTITKLTGTDSGHAIAVTWANMGNGDVGAPVSYPEYRDRSVHVEGTFGTGGNVQVGGSNSGSGGTNLGNSYPALTYDNTSTINISAVGVKGIAEAVANIQPKVTAGDGTTSLTVTIFFGR